MKNESILRTESGNDGKKIERSGKREKIGKGGFSAKSKYVFALVCLFCTALALHARAPYRIRGEISYDPAAGVYEYGAAALTFYNASGRTVRKFFVVVFLSESGGQTDSAGDNCITLECGETVAPYAVVNAEFGLVDHISESDEETYHIDFLYVSKIEYEDGGVWEDPYGVRAK